MTCGSIFCLWGYIAVHQSKRFLHISVVCTSDRNGSSVWESHSILMDRTDQSEIYGITSVTDNKVRWKTLEQQVDLLGNFEFFSTCYDRGFTEITLHVQDIVLRNLVLLFADIER